MDAKAATRPYCLIQNAYLRRGFTFLDARAARGIFKILSNFSKIME